VWFYRCFTPLTRDKTRQFCLVCIGGVNTTAHKTRQFCRISTCVPTADVDKTKCGQDKTVLCCPCQRCEQAIRNLSLQVCSVKQQVSREVQVLKLPKKVTLMQVKLLVGLAGGLCWLRCCSLLLWKVQQNVTT